MKKVKKNTPTTWLLMYMEILDCWRWIEFPVLWYEVIGKNYVAQNPMGGVAEYPVVRTMIFYDRKKCMKVKEILNRELMKQEGIP